VDAIDAVLDGLKLQSSVFSRMELRGGWGFSKASLEGAPFHIVLEGEAWVEATGGKPTRIGRGEMAILPRGLPYRLLSKPGADAVPFQRVLVDLGLEHWKPGDRVEPVFLRMGTGKPVTKLVSGVFDFTDPRKNPLVASLPEVLVLRESDVSTVPGAHLVQIGRMISDEIEANKLGARLAAARLADYLFVQAVRAHLVSSASTDPGWLRGLRDPSVGASLAMIHADPRRDWSVKTLAQEVGMSRSQFAQQFKLHVGQAPIEYLTTWRMFDAASRLDDRQLSLKEIARNAGYNSVAAFGKAFKRWAGASPAAMRRGTRGGSTARLPTPRRERR